MCNDSVVEMYLKGAYLKPDRKGQRSQMESSKGWVRNEPDSELNLPDQLCGIS